MPALCASIEQHAVAPNLDPARERAATGRGDGGRRRGREEGGETAAPRQRADRQGEREREDGSGVLGPGECGGAGERMGSGRWEGVNEKLLCGGCFCKITILLNFFFFFVSK